MRNRNGIEVRECCASCKFRHIESARGRFCSEHRVAVKKNDRCKSWEISEGIQHAGDGGGMVKTPEYLKFLVQMRDRELEGENLCGSRSPREIYEELYGSIYINI